MKNLAYIKIDDSLTPLKAAEQLELAKKNGFEDILVLHEKDAPFYTTPYKEKLLSLFRAAYRSKVRLYIGDDSHFMAGTGFGQVGSVKDVRGRLMCIKNKSEVGEAEEIIAERGDECVTVAVMSDKNAERLSFYPDVTNPECAQLVIECVYKPLLREFEKFKGYEFAGFYCASPSPLTWMEPQPLYMKSVVDRFEKEHNRLPDFFSLAAKEGDYEEYERLAEVCVEEIFIETLRSYCEENGLKLVIGNMGGEHVDYCKRHNMISTSTMGAKDSYQMHITEANDVLDSEIGSTGGVMQIRYSMGKLAKFWDFLQKNSDAEVVTVDKFNSCDKDCYIIRSEKTGQTVSFLLDGDWCVLDWENDAIYDFDKKGIYNFGLGGFLCIRRKSADMYTEKLPARVGAVLTRELEYEKGLDFIRGGNSFRFTLPEEKLTGKYIHIGHSGGYLKLKMGYNIYESISYPCIFPLYDFLGGVECEGVLDVGKADSIAIYENKKY